MRRRGGGSAASPVPICRGGWSGRTRTPAATGCPLTATIQDQPSSERSVRASALILGAVNRTWPPRGDGCPYDVGHCVSSGDPLELFTVMSVNTSMYRRNPSMAAVPIPNRFPVVVSETVSMEWSDQAACLHEDPELFFPASSTGPAGAQIEEAKAVCGHCPVLDACFSYALQSGQDAGIWGGLTEEERRIIKRRTVRPRRAG